MRLCDVRRHGRGRHQEAGWNVKTVTKREPREWWQVIDGEGRPFAMDDRANALRFKREWNRTFRGSGPHEAVLVREVLPSKPRRKGNRK